MATTGTAVIDFGSTATNYASVAVTGQAGILTTSQAEAWFMGSTTASNNESNHEQANFVIHVECSIPTAGVGFTINAHTMIGTAAGQFNVQWVWN